MSERGGGAAVPEKKLILGFVEMETSAWGTVAATLGDVHGVVGCFKGAQTVQCE
jgi:hypothetical protein